MRKYFHYLIWDFGMLFQSPSFPVKIIHRKCICSSAHSVDISFECQKIMFWSCVYCRFVLVNLTCISLVLMLIRNEWHSTQVTLVGPLLEAHFKYLYLLLPRFFSRISLKAYPKLISLDCSYHAE